MPNPHHAVVFASLVLAGLWGFAAAGCGRQCGQGWTVDVEQTPTHLLPTAYVWFGAKDIAPPCPPGAPDILFEVYADLSAAAHTCPVCACGPSETTCQAPTQWNAVAAACDDPAGAEQTPFDAVPGWDGICSTTAKIQAGKTCAGGIPCAQSVTVDPPAVVSKPCMPVSMGVETKPDPSWMTFARGCKEDLDYDCNTGPKSKGAYRQCKRLENAADDCPASFTERHELFGTFTDDRACSPCTCGAPEGGTCTMKVGAYSDEACGSPVGSAYASASGPAICFDVPDGAALLGKTAELASASPGECAPAGGEPMGEVAPAQPVTWCCYVPSE